MTDKETNEKTLEDFNYLAVPSWLFDWELEADGRNDCAFVISTIYNCIKNKEALNLDIDDDYYIKITTTDILKLLYKTITADKLRTVLKKLKLEGIIETAGSRHTFTIKLSDDVYTAVKNSFEMKQPFFKLYYSIFDYEKKNHPRSHVSYLFCRLLQEAEQLDEYMYNTYLKSYFLYNNAFSSEVLKNMLKILKDDGYIKIQYKNYRTKETDSGYGQKKMIILQESGIVKYYP